MGSEWLERSKIAPMIAFLHSHCRQIAMAPSEQRKVEMRDKKRKNGLVGVSFDDGKQDGLVARWISQSMGWIDKDKFFFVCIFVVIF